jgi:hypothetical protein
MPALIDSGFQDVLGQAKKLLAESPIAELKRIRLEQHGETITLSGRLSNFYLKQQAQETIRPAMRGLRVRNAVRVDSDS